jgi:hypothetical protein
MPAAVMLRADTQAVQHALDETARDFAKACGDRVHGVRVRGLRSLPGITRLQFKLTYYRIDL